MNAKMNVKILLFPLLLLPGVALARGKAITGEVVDRNGEPLSRVNVAVEPGNVEIITDDNGSFRLDYLRDEEGNRIRLKGRVSYEITFFKVGYHEEVVTAEYKRGELVMEAITLTEDTIKVEASTESIDPARFSDRAQNTGGSYEGE